MLVDLLRRSCYAGLRWVATKRIGTAARRRAGVMLWRSCYAGMQLEVSKCSVTASRKVVFHHGSTLLLFGIAAGRCKTHCAGCAKRRIELGCRSCKRLSWEAAQSRRSPDKWLLREEVAERRGASTKRSLIGSLIDCFIDSLNHWFMDSAWFTDSLVNRLFCHWFIDSSAH